MSAKKRCPKCGTVIPEWSHGASPNCERITSTEKRFWKGGRKRFSTRSYAHSRGYTGRNIKSTTTHPQELKRALPPIDASQVHRRLHGYDQLLCNIYRRPVHLGRILARQGFSLEQVARWRHDPSWLDRFIQRLHPKLMALLRSSVPSHDPSVLELWYTLNGEPRRTVEAIADKLQITAQEVRATHQAFLAYLRGATGHLDFGTEILDAANEVEKF